MDPINDTAGNATPVPAQNAPASVPAAPAVSDDPAAQDQAAASIAATTGGPKPIPVPTPGQNMSQGQPQSTAAKVFQAIAGGQATDYLQTPNGPVPVKRNLKPGEMARSILASAFSLLSAGTGGDLAAREGRQYVQPKEQTIGGMQEEQQQQKQQEAQKEFQNKQEADAATLQAHKAATEQQESIGRIQEYADNHRKFMQAYDNGELESKEKLYDFAEKQKAQTVTDLKNWRSYMAEPGAEVMKDAKGAPISFFDIGRPGDPGYVSAGQQLQKYIVDNPNLLHGSNNGNPQDKYGVLGAVNPWTGGLQLINLPQDRNEKGLIHVGQKIDADGNPVYDKSGNPVANTDSSKGPVIYDPKTKKPTVLSQTVTAAQVGDIVKGQINEQNIKSEIDDRAAQAKLRNAQAAAVPALSDALSIYNSGGVSKLTPKQLGALQTLFGREYTLATTHLQQMEQDMQKVSAFDPTTPEAVEAKKNYTEAKNNYDDAQAKYDELTGLTPGVRKANAIIRAGNAGANWPSVNQQIATSGLPPAEQEVAKAKVWNSMSPAQQAAASNGTASAAQGGATIGKPTTTTHQVNDQITLSDGRPAVITAINPDGSIKYKVIK